MDICAARYGLLESVRHGMRKKELREKRAAKICRLKQFQNKKEKVKNKVYMAARKPCQSCAYALLKRDHSGCS